MNKYQEAYEVIGSIIPKGLLIGKLEDLPKHFESFKELVDRDKENFGYILRTKDSRFHTRIAFHTEKEALEFVHKYEVKGCSLDGVKFFKDSDYENK